MGMNFYFLETTVESDNTKEKILGKKTKGNEVPVSLELSLV